MNKPTKAYTPNIDHDAFNGELDALESEILAMSDGEVVEQLYKRGIEPCDRDYLVRLGIYEKEPVSETISSKENSFLVRCSAIVRERMKSYFSSWPKSALIAAVTLALGIVVQAVTYTVMHSNDGSNQSPVQVRYDSNSPRTNTTDSAAQNQTRTSTELPEKQWALVKGTDALYAVYIRPESTSPLLTRVISGTKLVVTDTTKSWSEVLIDIGVGFMRSDDIILCNVGAVAIC